ncbi:MAG: endonuclease/exonuclease/phosphatase family protein [Fimbriimonadales bacterium]
MKTTKGWTSFLLSLTLVLGWAQQEVRILNWNIARSVGANNPESTRQPYTAKIMNHLRPDIMILQEVGGNTSGWNALNQEQALDTFIRTNLTFFGSNPQRNRDYYLYVNRLSDGWISNAIVSRFPMISATDVSIGSPNRGLTIGLINVPGTNGLGVMGAHFKAGGTTNDAVTRQTNAENTRNRVLEWRRQNRRSALVLGGDLNENEDPDLSSTFQIGGTLPDGRTYAPISTVESARLRDPVPLDGLGTKRTYQITASNTTPRRRLDHLFVSATELGRDRINVIEAILFNTRRMPNLPSGFQIDDSPNASDHAALFYRLRIDRWQSLGNSDAGYWVPEPNSLLQLVVLVSGSGVWLGIRRRRLTS